MASGDQRESLGRPRGGDRTCRKSRSHAQKAEGSDRKLGRGELSWGSCAPGGRPAQVALWLLRRLSPPGPGGRWHR